MSDTMASLSVDLWDRDPVYRLVLRWVEGKEVRFYELSPTQVANFARAALEIENPEEMLPSAVGAQRLTRLEKWLEDAAGRGDEQGTWRRRGETRPLTSEIPALFRHVLTETLDKPVLPPNVKFHRIWGEAVPEEVVVQRRLAVLREATTALVKCHRVHRSRKAGRNG